MMNLIKSRKIIENSLQENNDKSYIEFSIIFLLKGGSQGTVKDWMELQRIAFHKKMLLINQKLC